MSSLQELADEAARKVAAVTFDGKEWDRTRKTRIVLEYMKKAVAESEDRYDGAVRSIIELERKTTEMRERIVSHREKLEIVGICPDCGGEFKCSPNEPIATCKCGATEWTEPPPVLQMVRRELAKAGHCIKVLEDLIEGEMHQKEPFGPLIRCRYCNTIKGNGHSVDCRIGLTLMRIYPDAARAKEAGDGKD